MLHFQIHLIRPTIWYTGQQQLLVNNSVQRQTEKKGSYNGEYYHELFYIVMDLIWIVISQLMFYFQTRCRTVPKITLTNKPIEVYE